MKTEAWQTIISGHHISTPIKVVSQPTEGKGSYKGRKAMVKSSALASPANFRLGEERAGMRCTEMQSLYLFELARMKVHSLWAARQVFTLPA